MDKDVTNEVKFGAVDGETLCFYQCVCGKGFEISWVAIGEVSPADAERFCEALRTAIDYAEELDKGKR